MLKGRKVLVLGLARSGRAAVRLLQRLGADITINEFQPATEIPEYQEYLASGVEVIAGGHPQELFERDFDFVVKNPGINYHKDFILRLKERQIPIYTEIELAFQYAKPQKYLAITGTNGKTTTVKLLYHILSVGSPRVHLAGNVGEALCDVVMDHNLLEESDHCIVLEMSNFQLLDIENFKPLIATIINLTPDHLDYMASLEEYYASKTNIYLNQDQNDYYVENLDDPILAQYIHKYPVKSKRVTVSFEKKADVTFKKGTIFFQNQPIIDEDRIKIVGRHNIQNIMIAVAYAKILGLNNQEIADRIADFQGVAHRIEYVGEYRGVKYYNDSKATNTDATVIALKAFKQPVILLMGGFDKGLSLIDIKKQSSKIKKLITFGASAQRFKADMAIGNSVAYNHLADAVIEAIKTAEAGDIVLLSPSTSSFDEFSGMGERGECFKEIVRKYFTK